jgi:hypothetical protein
MERDRDGQPFEDDFTENRGPSAREREYVAEHETLDPDVDSQTDDESMEKNVFGVDEVKPKA